MHEEKDDITKAALEAINAADAPLETKELELILSAKMRGITRAKLFYRLNLLRGEGRIYGKFVGPGKGVWIWWKIGAFAMTAALHKGRGERGAFDEKTPL